MRRILIGWLLDVAYFFALVAALPWIVWSMLVRGKYREGYAQKLFGLVPRHGGDGPCIWLHAVSVGEVNVLGTLISSIESRWPDMQIFISSTTKTGFDLACRRYARHTVFYCPLDFTWAVRRAMNRIRPTLLILAELELWPNLVWAAKRHGAAVAVINGRVSEASFRGYRRIRPLVARVLREIDVIAAQNETTAQRFVALGAPAHKVRVTGSMKFDGAQTDRGNAATARLRHLAAIGDGDVVFIAGSTQAPEEALAIESYRTLVREFPSLRLILVPRHPQRFDEVANLLLTSGLPFVRRTQLDATALQIPNPKSQIPNLKSEISNLKSRTPPAPVLLVDTIGELAAWWGVADIAFVGGSLFSTRGGQNMIEPAAYAAAVSFGPNTRNFRDIVHALREANAACVVSDGDELTDFVRRCLTDRNWAADLGQRAQTLVRSQLGATERTLTLLEALLSESSDDRPTRACHARPAA
jgi:3-deoxy-D-manno-octulosonic-acid transferase